jgi:hypothetical protein
LIDDADPDCAPAPVCTDITVKSACNDDPSCTWVGNPKTGYCEDAICTVTETTELTCGDGIDNDCDGAVGCDDADCGCPPPDCSVYGDRSSCNGDPQCKWSGKNKVCNPA